MKIHFSNQDNLRNIRRFVQSLDFSNPKKLSISTHDKWATVHPANLVFAAALALGAGKENSEIVGDIPQSGIYLDRMGLFNFVHTQSPFHYSQKEPSGRFIPITIIKTADDQSRFIADMVPLLHLSEKNATVVKYVIGELVRNVLEHAQANNGAIVAAQYYKRTNRIGLGICDTGIGLKQSLDTFWKPKTDLEAIYLALTPGITGTTYLEGGTFDNAGAGLFIIKSISKMTRNYFAIYSGNAEYTLLKYPKRLKGFPKLHSSPMKDRHNETDSAPHFAGTLVGVDISLDETDELNVLLTSIGRVHDEAIRERKRIKYQEPKFL